MDADKITRTADELIEKHVAPRLKDAHQTQQTSQIHPQEVAMAAAALHRGVWTEKDVKRYFDKKMGG